MANPALNIMRYPDVESLAAPVDYVDEEMSISYVTAAIEVMRWLEHQLISE